MKIERWVMAGTMALSLVAATPAISATLPGTPSLPTKMVVTVLPAPQKLEADDLTVLQDNRPAPIIHMQRLSGDTADMQLFVLLDDSTRAVGLGTQLPELKAYLKTLPGATQVAVGYMRNGSFSLAQAFTSDHEKAASSLRLPMGVPGENGSPYFALSNLVEHWPSQQPASRRAVLMFTDGVDRYYTSATEDDPYADEAIHNALKQGVMVYSIYLRGAGLYGRSNWATTIAQSRLIDVSEQTGGYAYYQAFSDPVSISPFLNDFQNRLNNQYEVTIRAWNEKGFQPVKLRTRLPGLKVYGPTRIFIP